MSILKPFFVFGGVSSKSMCLTIEDKDILSGAEADVTEYEIPGRDGTVFESNGRYNNIEIAYETYLKVAEQEDLPRFTGELKRWLLSGPGEYRRLEDTYDPDHYRIATVQGGLKIEQAGRRFTRQSILFSCKPFRYRKSGERKIKIGDGLTLQNDTGFTARPKIEINMQGSGLVLIRVEGESGTPYATSIETTGAQRLILDSASEEALQSGNTTTSYIPLDTFPELRPGKNRIIISGAKITSAQITPCWREL